MDNFCPMILWSPVIFNRVIGILGSEAPSNIRHFKFIIQSMFRFIGCFYGFCSTESALGMDAAGDNLEILIFTYSYNTIGNGSTFGSDRQGGGHVVLSVTVKVSHCTRRCRLY